MSGARVEPSGPVSYISYPVRAVIGAALFLVLLSVFHASSSIGIWGLMVFHGFIWPHLANQHLKRVTDPERAEQRNMLFGAFIVGFWGPLMSFQLWPTVTMYILVCLWSTALGGGRYLLRSLLTIAVGALLGGAITGYAVQTRSEPIAIVVSISVFAFLALRFATLTFQVRSRMAGLAGKISRYISPQVYASIFSGEQQVGSEIRRKRLTVFFSDIKDFTTITDHTEPEVLASLLGEYLTEMSQIALRHGGTIDKFIGDAVMIFFGDPESRGVREDALACVHMALEMRAAMHKLNQQWEDLGVGHSLQIRMGISTGYCSVGNFGSHERYDYTIIGSTVNLASRLESNASADGILIAHESYALIKDEIACIEMGEIQVKGFEHPVQAYHVIDARDKVSTYINQISEEFSGFSLSVDLQQASASDVLRALNHAIDRIRLAETYLCELQPESEPDTGDTAAE